MGQPKESHIVTPSNFERGFEARVVTPPGAETLQSHRDHVADIAELHAEEIRTRCAGLQSLGGCAARVDVTVLNEHIPSLNKVETYRVVCSKPCDSNLPKVERTETSVQITQAS